MKAKLRSSILLCFVLGLAAAWVPAQTPEMPQFSADLAMTTEKKGQSMTGKMYFGGKRWRWDMSMQGQKSSMIIDGGSETMYMIIPEQKMYMEFRTDQQMPGAPDTSEMKPVDPENPCANDPNVTCKKVGTEVVNGRTTDKWVFTDRKQRETHTAWVDQKLRFPVRVQHQNGSSMELTNIQEGAQPDSLFQVPAGFQKLDMGGMMKGTGRPQ